MTVPLPVAHRDRVPRTSAAVGIQDLIPKVELVSLPMTGRKSFMAVAALVVLTVSTCLPAVPNGFIWDDNDYFTENRAMTRPDGLQIIWSSPTVSRHYPLTLTTFWVQRRLWGFNPLWPITR